MSPHLAALFLHPMQSSDLGDEHERHERHERSECLKEVTKKTIWVHILKCHVNTPHQTTHYTPLLPL